MRKIFLAFGLLCLSSTLAGCGTDSSMPLTSFDSEDRTLQNEETIQEEYPQLETDENYVVVFYDDFDGDSIPNPDKWVLAQKGDTNWSRYLSESYAQAYQKEGILYLKGEKIDGVYKTAGLETRGKFEFCHGKVECRARFLRQPQGNHTGIWMMPAPPALQWPKSGEIDIMEHLNSESKIFETVHSWYADDLGHSDSPKSQEEVSVDNEDWNIYGLVWTETELIYTVNGKPYLSYPNLSLAGETGNWQWPFNHDFYLILSQSLGGEGTWAGKIDDSELPAVFQIDWIKVSQKKETSGVPTVRPD